MADIRVANHGSILILNGITPAGEEWLSEHCSDEAGEVQTWGGGIVVEPRYVNDIINGAIAEGLEVSL